MDMYVPVINHGNNSKTFRKFNNISIDYRPDMVNKMKYYEIFTTLSRIVFIIIKLN